MRYEEAIYWTRKALQDVAYRISEQDYLGNDDQKLLREVDDAQEELSRIGDLVNWLETNNYIEEEI